MIQEIKREVQIIKSRSNQDSDEEPELGEDFLINRITKIHYQKCYSLITLKIQDFEITLKALIDARTNQDCKQQDLIPIKYFEKTTKTFRSANSQRLNIKYKLPNVRVCNQEFCFVNSFLLIKSLNQELVLGTPFLTQLYPIKIWEKCLICEISRK